jgi:excisionase family DNA binding protein
VTPPPADDPPAAGSLLDELMTSEEVAELLAMRRSTIDDYARRGLLPSLKLGRHRRLRPHRRRARDRRAPPPRLTGRRRIARRPTSYPVRERTTPATARARGQPRPQVVLAPLTA